MITKQHRQNAYDCYNDEVAQVYEELEDGKISQQQANKYLENLALILKSELSEIGD